MNLLNILKGFVLDIRRFAFMVVCVFVASAGHAQILATSARQASSGSLKFLAYYQGVQDQTVRFSADRSGDVDAQGSGGAAAVKIAWQPWERFQYYGTLSGGDYALRVPSTTVTNLLSGDARGLSCGAGIKASIVPETIVTPAVALDFGVTRSLYNFNRRFPGGALGIDGNISQRLELMTYQLAVESSRLFAFQDRMFGMEPYGGVKWTRVQSDLKDLVDGSHSGGQKDAMLAFLGLRLSVGDHEAFFAEASFLDGCHYGAGLELRFK